MANNDTVKRYHKLMAGMPGMGGVSTWGGMTTMLDEKLEYYVLSFDDKGARPAQIRDRIVASG